jgi:hypothetical protein
VKIETFQAMQIVLVDCITLLDGAVDARPRIPATLLYYNRESVSVSLLPIASASWLGTRPVSVSEQVSGQAR